MNKRVLILAGAFVVGAFLVYRFVPIWILVVGGGLFLAWRSSGIRADVKRFVEGPPPKV